MSLRNRLLLAAAYLLAVVVIALEAPLWLNIDRRATSELASEVLGNAATLAAQIADLVDRSNAPGGRFKAPPDRRTQIVAARATQTGTRVLVTDGAGRALADSADEAVRGELYATAQRPEIQTGLFDGRVDVRRRFSDELGEELLLVTVPVVDAERVVGAVRMSEPMGDVAAGVRRSWLALGLIGAGVIAVGLALAWLLATSLLRPVRRLEHAAVRLGRGDLEARAAPGGPSEVVTLSRSFNHYGRHARRQPSSAARLRRECITSVPNPAHGSQAETRGDQAAGRLRGRAVGQGRGGARPAVDACG